MSMNKESFDYIKSIFTNQSQVNDYIANLQDFVTAASGPVSTATAYFNAFLSPFLTQDPSETEGMFGIYDGEILPSPVKILIPDNNDPYWSSFKVSAIKYVIENKFLIKSPSDADVIEFLSSFDDSIPTSSKVSINDPLLNKAWDKWYSGVSGALNQNSLFGNVWSSVRFVSAIITRLKTVNIESSNIPDVQPGETSDEVYSTIDTSAERLQALEEFLGNANIVGGFGTNTSQLLLLKNRQNNLPAEINQETYTYLTFRSVIAPTQDVLNLDEKYQRNLFEKIESSGLYDLVIYADAIMQYRKKKTC